MFWGMLLGSAISFCVSFILFAIVVILEERDQETLSNVIKIPAILTGKTSEILFILGIIYETLKILGV